MKHFLFPNTKNLDGTIDRLHAPEIHRRNKRTTNCSTEPETEKSSVVGSNN